MVDQDRVWAERVLRLIGRLRARGVDEAELVALELELVLALAEPGSAD
jgi:hypothetical protein